MAENSYQDKLSDPRWQRKRLEIFNRDNWTCQSCQTTTETLHVHHIRYNDHPWDSPDNELITLCESCHKVETSMRKDLEEHIILSLRSKGFLYKHLYDLGYILLTIQPSHLEDFSKFYLEYLQDIIKAHRQKGVDDAE